MTPIIICYVGAYPAGRPAPDLASMPLHDDVDLYFALSFARDKNHDGVFSPVWDEAISPELIAQLKEDDERRKFLLSLAGDGHPWREPQDNQEWVQNAVSSISELMDQYHLDGVDVNYEQNIGGSFSESVGRVLTELKSQKGAVTSIAPFAATWEAYKAMYTQAGDQIDFVGYQAYAEDLDRDAYNTLYDSLSEVTGSYEKLLLGVASSQSSPRGMQPPAIYDVLGDLKDKGLGGLMVWCGEDSASYTPPYDIEVNAESILAEGEEEEEEEEEGEGEEGDEEEEGEGEEGDEEEEGEGEEGEGEEGEEEGESVEHAPTH